MRIKKSHLKELIRNSIIDKLSEDSDDKYVHIGYGKYKEKGKEKDKDSQTFAKDDSGKIYPLGKDAFGSDVGGPAHPNVPKKKTKSKMDITKLKRVQESIKESRGRRCTVKEIKKWFKSLEENRYKKTYASDARRVSWFVNNNLSEDYDTMPISMKKKWSKAAYGRERFLAKEFIKHLKSKQMNEQKLRKTIRSIIKETLLKEGKLNESKLTTTFYFDQSKYINNIRDILAKNNGGAKAFKFMGNSKPKHMVLGGHKMKMSGTKATMWNGIPNNKVKEAEKFFKSHGLKWLKTQQNYPNMRPTMRVKEDYNSGMDIEVPTKDMGKVDKILQKLKLKPGKDYNKGVGGAFGSGRTFILKLSKKIDSKVIELLAKNRIKIRG